MRKSKRILFWTICYFLSLACLIIAFPTLLFTFYPYNVIAVAVYAVAIILLSVLSFRRNAIEHTIIKKVLFGMLLVPIIALLMILASIETGWIHYPG